MNNQRKIIKQFLFVALCVGAWAVFPPKKALWTDGALLLLVLAIGDILEQ